MAEVGRYLYRPQVYQAQLHRQHINFLRQGFNAYLTIPNPSNSLQYAALLAARAEGQIIARLNNKENRTQNEHLFLVVALKLAGQNFHAELGEFKRAFPGLNHSEQIEKYINYFSRIPVAVSANNNKQKVRWEFERLLGKANTEGYYSIPEVPVFLVSARWLEHLFSSALDLPPPVSNETLLEPVAYPLADANYLHYNYRVREDLREEKDYKLVSFEAWQLLQKAYGGVEVRRLTTREKLPIVEVWLTNVNVLVVEERCVFHRVELQVSKGDSFAQLVERLKIILARYRIVPEKYLGRSFSLYKSKELSEREVVSVLQDDSRPQITHPNFERIAEWSIQVEQAGILTPHDFLILNLSAEKGIFGRLPALKVMTVREKCLNCGSVEDLSACKCRNVFFCGAKCREAQKGHQKECDSLQVEARRFNAVVEYHSVRKRSFPQLKNLHLSGKVGLENLGNTCYMNSALQCLARLTDLAEFFLRNGHLAELNVTNVLGSDGHMACAFGEFLKNFYTSGRRKLQPTDILRILQRNAQFRGHNHQDSQEFLNYFLDKLHEDLNRVKVKPYTQEVESNGRPDEQVSRLSWQNYKLRNDSFISDLFAGQYRSKIMCPDCRKVSITFDPFLSVTLQFPRPDKSEALEGFFMTSDGEFQKMKVEAKSNAPAYDFYKKFFKTAVQGANVKDKRIAELWDSTKSVFQNRKSGLLFFYEKPDGHSVQIHIEFPSVGKETPQHLPRVTFAKNLHSEQDLLRSVLLAIKNPLKKAIMKDLTEEEYLSLCIEKKIINIRSLDENQTAVTFPVTGARSLRVRVELLHERLSVIPPKMNIAVGSYQGLEESLVRRVREELSMRELIECFSEPQQLTEDNTWYCPSCKDHKLADKAMSLYTLPQYLIIHLKRFNHRGNRFVIYGEKVNTVITLEEFEEIGGKQYELLGVVNHFGSLVHGHYTACVKREEWYNYNDGQCSRSRLDGKNAYLLFYKRVQ